MVMAKGNAYPTDEMVTRMNAVADELEEALCRCTYGKGEPDPLAGLTSEEMHGRVKEIGKALEHLADAWPVDHAPVTGWPLKARTKFADIDAMRLHLQMVYDKWITAIEAVMAKGGN